MVDVLFIIAEEGLLSQDHTIANFTSDLLSQQLQEIGRLIIPASPKETRNSAKHEGITTLGLSGENDFTSILVLIEDMMV